ncbi:glutaredoxin domain-containing protein [Citricoccus sp. K5]|uniref:glutaredoxin domain-containing protein n=1 Tax=Citricoccus sp. K5 TaxID=2653135 RepID=UPI0012F2A6AA|nr:glutaredoxin domain-containing protein [Citricoccus sp. K5]VXA93322.1 Glutaredoxin-like protein NrdH, required for reduction of Ribonucleotide reductase class Ib [Citricoccus sp. K5]VXA95978.1 Glutaredoxin-like protein NrdH, required for reduction of Ribonucleotide reductase class Ib [Citricoccus sp. K5]
MRTITVYSKTNCQQCTATKRWLTKAGTPYEVKQVDLPLASAERDIAAIKALGYKGVPVTIVSRDGVPDEHWHGFRPDKLEAFCAADFEEKVA